MPDEKTNQTFGVAWTERMRHSADPNRVGTRQIPAPAPFEPAGPPNKLPPSDAVSVRTGEMTTLSAGAPRPQDRSTEPSYYDIPILQSPTWKWQIAAYFYLGGLSAGAYLIGRAAERLGHGQYRELSRIGGVIALAAILPAPPLLIADLGDPRRFHHMLRVWKPTTPMNLGTWAITLYGAHATFDVVRQYLVERGKNATVRERGALNQLMNNGTLMLIHDAAGVPLALMVATYTGVLLSCTSNPLWCKNPFLAPLFSASAISTGAEAISLGLDLFSKTDPSAAQKVLMTVDSAAHAAELGCLEGFRRYAGEKAKPLTHGRMRKQHFFSVAGIVAAEVIKRLPADGNKRRPLRMLASALGLAAGFSLRWAMVQGAHEAAADPHLSRAVSRRKT